MAKITEEWARTAPAGQKLDRICAEWMGWKINPLADNAPAPYSTDWSAAGPLLEAMNADFPIWSLAPPSENSPWIMIPYSMDSLKYTGGNRYTWPRAEDPELAIARACGVLVARGITRSDIDP